MEHHFDIEFAKEHGFAAAVIYRHFQFWIAHNKANNKNCQNGRTWTYNSQKAFKELFPYLTEWQIRRAVDRLLEQGILIKDHFGKKVDRTIWYAFTDEKTALQAFPAHLSNTQMDLSITQMDTVKTTNGYCENHKCILGTDKEPVNETIDKTEISQKGLSEADQERGYQLLLKYAVDAKTAKAIVYDQHTPMTSIEEAIKNGLAKQSKEKGFVLQAGYIIASINGARAEGKIIKPTKNSERLHNEIKIAKLIKSVPKVRLSDAEFRRRQQEQTTALQTPALKTG